jgi:5-methylcytosine-specific restriction protein A
MVCGFDFEKVYGEHGSGFTEVHHLKPLSELGKETKVDPITDMVVVCPNCHRMIHRNKDNILSLGELTEIVRQREKA